MVNPDHRSHLDAALRSFQRKDLLRRVLEVGLGLALIGWLAVVVLGVLERGLEPTLALRGALGGGFCVLVLASLGLGLARILRGPGDLETAWAIERGLGGRLHACLATAIEYRQRPEAPGIDPSLVTTCAEVAANALADCDAGGSISFGKAQRRAAWLLGLFLVLGGLVGWNPWAHYHLLTRFVAPGLGIEIPVPVRFLVRPGEARVLAGTRFRPHCEVEGEAPGRLVAVCRFGEGLEERLDPVSREGSQRAFDFGTVDRSFDYYFELGAYRSPAFRVTVVDPPRPSEVRLAFRFPPHTHLPDRVQATGDLDVVAPRGTRVELRVATNRPLARASVQVLPRGEAEPRVLAGEVREDQMGFTAAYPVESSGSWWIELEDVEGFEDPAPRHHRLVAEEDSLPRVFVLEPGKDLEQPGGNGPRVDLQLHATDGFGVRELSVDWSLRTRRSFRDREQTGRIPVALSGEPSEVTTRVVLDLSRFSLAPGDRIQYRARVRDSRPGDPGDGEAFSHRYRIVVPFPRDEHAQLSEEEAEHSASMEALLEEQKSWEKRLDRTLRDASADGEISWKERRELEELLQEEGELRRKVQDLVARMEQSLEEAQASGILEPEIEEKMQQVQDVLRKLADVDMHERMDELKKLLEQVQVDQGEIKELRKQYDEDAHSKSLERMLEALQKLKTQQEIEKVRAQAEALVEDQEKLQEETRERTEEGEQLESLAEEQGKLQERAEELAEELEKLQEELGEESESARKGLEDAQDAIQKGDSAEKQMAEAQQQLQQNQGQKAEQSQSRASRRLRQAESALQQASKGLQSDRRAVNLEAVVRMVRLGLEVSRGQEDVVAQAWESDRDPRKLCRVLASDQDGLFRGIHRFEGRFEDSLEDELELKERFLTAVSDLVDNFREAKVAFEQVKPFTGRQLARSALVKLNQVLAELLDIQEEIQDSMASASQQQMMETLRRMIKQQEMLNKKTERLQQEPGDAEHKRRMAREMSQDQGQLREELEKMRAEAREKRELEGMGKKLGELGKEMGEVEEALREMALTEQLRTQQRRIVTRMLDMAASLQKQGESQKREARAPSPFLPPPSPAEPPDLAETRRRFFENQEREGSPLEDQEAVERYLDLLSSEDAGTAPAPDGVAPPAGTLDLEEALGEGLLEELDREP